MQTKQEKRREWYLRRQDYYKAQNAAWRAANRTKHLEKSNAWYKKTKQTDPIKYLLKYAKARAAKKEIDFSLTREDIILPEICPVFKRPFINGDPKWSWSIDRIDPLKGYTKENIQILSALANKMKWDSTKEELVSFAKGILDVYAKEV